MSEEFHDLKQALTNFRCDVDFMQKIDCSIEDNKKYAEMVKEGLALPEGVYQYKDDQEYIYNRFYTLYETDLTPEEKIEYLTFRKMQLIKTIKNCVVFFTVITVIGIVATILLLITCISCM